MNERAAADAVDSEAIIPRSTYRLQLNREFTFDDAAAIVPYLHLLGVSHVYASPYLKARSNSPHGYDIVAHDSFNPEIGDRDAFERFVAVLRAHDMGHILDFVPNHMAVGGDDNAWWLDVLEHGPASPYAEFFDIDWHPVREELRNKVLLPFLGDYYGAVLDRGELRIDLDMRRGEFSVRYDGHRFPIDPRTYGLILNECADEASRGDENHAAIGELQGLIAACEALPGRSDLSPPSRERRLREAQVCKKRLADLCQRSPSVVRFIGNVITRFNGAPGRADSFDSLHRLLEAQAYRLAYWQVASDEINYRRFFDVNDLAGLRMENDAVFDATHVLVKSLVAHREVDGLRIDHPDGLSDPFKYFTRLRQSLVERPETASHDATRPLYVVVEKILASGEHLAADWPVYGTTGYEFAAAVNGLFVHPDSEKALGRRYARFIGHPIDFDELLYERKKLIIRTEMSGELTVLARLLDEIAEADRHTRDFTLNGLRETVLEVTACFPVYRTYITPERLVDDDRHYVERAIAQAKRRNPASEPLIFDFLRNILLARPSEQHAPREDTIRHFMMRFQQYTAPVTAKALEDTACYIYNRLVSLNDVGCDPRLWGFSLAAFHRANEERARQWPHTMISTSTHDSKRSEDVRARIDVLSELAEEWRRHLGRWSRLNKAKKHLVGGWPAPSRNDEYLLYQTLLGVWPLASGDPYLRDSDGRERHDHGPEETGPKDLDTLCQRIEDYMQKAIREAKIHTSWINPDPEYEQAVRGFVRALLKRRANNAFLADFLPFQRSIARLGLYNGLSQTLLKLTAPGVPDIYQGNELWTFSLVDPDNRRPVDYDHRHALLRELDVRCAELGDWGGLLRELLRRIEDGRAKLYVTWRALNLRRQEPRLFADGGYVPLQAEGARAAHICAFARHHDGTIVISVVSRWFARLKAGQPGIGLEDELIGETGWGETWIEAPEVPENAGTPRYMNVMSNEPIDLHTRNGRAYFSAVEVLHDFPVALLHAPPNRGSGAAFTDTSQRGE